LAGAVPAALMALSADYLLGLLGKRFDFGAKKKQEGSRVLMRRVAGATVLILIAIGAFALWRSNRSSTNSPESQNSPRVVIGSKDFTESIILSEIVAQVLESRGIVVERRFELAGNLCHESLIAGKIDMYPEYTGTSYTAILKHTPITDTREVYQQVKKEYAEKFQVEVSAPLGFSNDFAILVRGADARKLNLKSISDAVPYASKWRAGFGQDFMSRADGYAGFKQAYGFRFTSQPSEMDLALTYRALATNKVDLIAGNSTDGLIAALDLVQLVDDKHYFPPYEAVILMRRDAHTRSPLIKTALESLGNAIKTEEMRRLNYEVDGNKRLPKEVVREWLSGKGLLAR
jgi:glycine betaine/choline ABC-type transport system substrate-binding protein